MFIMRAIYLFAVLLTCCPCLSSYAQDEANLVVSEMTKENSGDTLDAAAILRGENSLAREQWLRRQLFIGHILTQTAAKFGDSTLFFRLQRQAGLSMDHSQLRSIPPRVDYIDERLRREQLDAPSPTLNFVNVVAAGAKFLAEKLSASRTKTAPLTMVPSETEIDILKVLWRQKKATVSEIYAQLDSMPLTATDLEQTLALMTQRGLLERQQISPKNEFTLPFGVTLEMSNRNRKNREYLYRPKVSRQTMLAFLDATAFSYRMTSVNSQSLIEEHLRRLMQRLVITEDSK